MLIALISAVALIVASAVTIFLTKQKERAAEWRSKKLTYYEEFFGAASGIVGTAQPNAKTRFATAVNNMHLIGSNAVLTALHEFCDEIAESNKSRLIDRHDELWSKLVWEIRNDLNDPPTKEVVGFRARLWASGVISAQ